MSIVTEAFEIVAALGTADSFEISTAMRSSGAWLFGTIVTLLAGCLMVVIYKTFPIIDRHLDRSVMVWSYLAIAAIIFWGVIDRFIFSN